MDRRKFLIRSGLTLGAAPLLSACQPSTATTEISEKPISFDTWPDIRNQFQFTSDRTHMSQMLLAAHPVSVRQAIEKYRVEFDKCPTEFWETNFEKKDGEVRQAAARYMGTDEHEIALTDSTTMGLAILYNGLKLKAGDEILTTYHDHYVTEKALEYATTKTGAVLKRVTLYSDAANASSDEMVSAIKSGISPKTRIVAMTYVHSCTGVKTPVKQISELVKEFNSKRNDQDRIYLCVDGVHGFGIENVSMTDLGCDFFAAGTHKWIFGPRGTGVLYGRRDAWNMIAPIIPSFEFNSYNSWLDLYPLDKLTFGDLCSPGGFHSFEYRWALIEAFDFQLKIGKKRVEERTRQLSTMLKDGLASMKHVKIITPKSPELSAGINCFSIDGMKPGDAVKKLLEKKIIASASPYKKSYVRLTPCIANTEEEVITCLKAIENINA